MKKYVLKLVRRIALRFGYAVVPQDDLSRLKIADQRLDIAARYLVRIDMGHDAEASWNKGSLQSFVTTLRHDGYGMNGRT